MLDRDDLERNFSDLTFLGNDTYRCKDVLPKITYFYYVKLRAGDHRQDLLLVSENKQDDEFASFILACVPSELGGSGVSVHSLSENKYGFSTLVIAKSEFHAYFKGRLDAERESLVLCFPAHKCEFSGDETIEEFSILRKDIIPTLDWGRRVSPKILLRFDNPKTGSGTGDSDVLVKPEVLMREIENISGVGSGFVEVSNYQGKVVEVLSPTEGEFTLIRDRDDSGRLTVTKDELLSHIWKFLTE